VLSQYLCRETEEKQGDVSIPSLEAKIRTWRGLPNTNSGNEGIWQESYVSNHRAWLWPISSALTRTARPL
jgi:hypothetical protein